MKHLMLVLLCFSLAVSGLMAAESDNSKWVDDDSSVGTVSPAGAGVYKNAWLTFSTDFDDNIWFHVKITSSSDSPSGYTTGYLYLKKADLSNDDITDLETGLEEGDSNNWVKINSDGSVQTGSGPPIPQSMPSSCQRHLTRPDLLAASSVPIAPPSFSGERDYTRWDADVEDEDEQPADIGVYQVTSITIQTDFDNNLWYVLRVLAGNGPYQDDGYLYIKKSGVSVNDQEVLDQALSEQNGDDWAEIGGTGGTRVRAGAGPPPPSA